MQGGGGNGKKAPISAIQIAKSAKRVHSQPQSPKNTLAKEGLFNDNQASNFAGFIKEQVKKIKKIQQIGENSHHVGGGG